MSHACGLCGEVFNSPLILKLHYLSHTCKTYQCEFCETSFSHEASLIVHCRNDHRKKLYLFEPNKSFLQNRDQKENCNQHKKEMLNRKCKNVLLFANDLDQDASVTPDAAKENEAGTVSDEEILGNLNTSRFTTGQSHANKRKYPCSTCGKTFAKKTNLKIHQRTHTNKRPFVCDICGKGFKQTPHLKNHRRIHSGEKPFACVTCGKTFTQTSSLKTHQRVHTKERPFICKTCGKTFTHKHHLTDHHRVHSKEKPFACDMCGKTFALKGYLNNHHKIHTNKKPCVF